MADASGRFFVANNIHFGWYWVVIGELTETLGQWENQACKPELSHQTAPTVSIAAHMANAIHVASARHRALPLGPSLLLTWRLKVTAILTRIDGFSAVSLPWLVYQVKLFVGASLHIHTPATSKPEKASFCLLPWEANIQNSPNMGRMCRGARQPETWEKKCSFAMRA